MNDNYLEQTKSYFLLAAILIVLPSILSFYKGHTGRILVSTEKTEDDKHFSRTVIYIFDHTIIGARGIVLNRPQPKTETTDNVPEKLFEFYKGGPVDYPSKKYVALPRPKSISYWRNQDLHVLDYKYNLIQIGKYKDGVMDMYLGFAGWGPGQLEKEISLGVWEVQNFAPEMLNHPDRSQLWQSLQKNKK